LVDNFNPKVKETKPNNWFAFVPTKQHKISCRFSETMDTTTLTTTNIKIHSLKSDSFDYPITNIAYVKDSFNLYLTVDSFRFKDTVQVRLLDGIKDLAGKSIQSSKQSVAYSWNFVVGVIQLTDNEVDDRSPDVYHGDITWIRGQIGNDYGEIMLYDFYQGTTNQISSGNDSNFSPVIWKNRVAWRRRSSNYFRSIYYYNGSVTQQIAQAVRGRYSLNIDSIGIVWRSCKQVSSYYDTIRIELYPFINGQTITLDSFNESYGRMYGQVDISGDNIVWDHSYNGYYYKNDIYLYNGYNTINITNTPDSSNREPVISDGQVAWKRNGNETSRPSSIWFYDGENNRRINESEWCYQPKINKGKVLWYRCYPSNQYSLHYYTGRKDTIIDQATCYYNYYQSTGIHNNQAAWTRYINSMVSNATCYEGNAIINLVNDPTSNTTRIEVHDGFIVYDAWDGHDYEVYLYLSDTLFTPPAVVKNLKGEVLGGKSAARKVKLTWKANTEPDLSGYKIYRSATSYQYGTTPYGTVLAPETTFTDTLPFEGMNYYVVTAYDNLNNESGFSNQASAFIDNIPPAVPTNLVASYDSINQRVSLIWHSSPDADLKLYKIYRSETSGNYATPIDSAFKPDTTFIDLTINLGKSYYYVVSAVDTNKNESGFSNEDTVIVPFFVASDFALATAYNNSGKIISSPSGGTVHFVYAQEGWLADAGIYYSYSVDSGKSFTSSEFVGGPGMYPALAIDTTGNPCASWVSGSNIYYTHWIASWAPPDTIVLPVVNVSPPSMVVDGTDTVHLVFVKYYVLPSDIGDLVYLKFSRTNFAGAVSETLLTNNFCRTPSLAIGPSRNLHILWQGAHCLCYQKKDSTGWLSRDTIYRTITNEKLYPGIDLYGTTINTAWQDKDTLGNIDIYSRIKTDVGWDLVKKVASTTGESKFPTLSGAHYCLWQDNSSGNWETYKSEYLDTLGNWMAPENISNTITGSAYPHSAYSLVNPTSAKLYCLWTEGDTIPYTVKFKKIDVSPVAKIYVDLGQSAQSPYCLKRDGSWTFGEKPFQTVDWAFDKLSYKLNGLNPQMEYRLDLSFYFENTRINIENALTVIKDEHRYDVKYDKDNGVKGIGRIIQALMVDGFALDTSSIKPNKLIRVSVRLPKEIYADSEIIIDISKIKGKVVVCGEIAVYEYFSQQKEILSGGPQQNRSDPMGINISFNIFPNPTRRNINIELRVTDNGILMNNRLRMKIFDITGRLVKQFGELNAQHKLDQIIWDGRDDAGKNLSAGVYFVQLEVGDFKQVKKAILMR
jgi:fibronectin type 3 domain-containing protein